MIYIKKSFYLSSNYKPELGQSAIDNLNELLGDVGVYFDVRNGKHEKKLVIIVNEKKLKNNTISKSGRPVEHIIDFEEVEKMKADGMTNKEIYTKLGISKSLFYLRLKEYKNNIGH